MAEREVSEPGATKDQRSRIGCDGVYSALPHFGQRQSGLYVRGLETCNTPGKIALASTYCKYILRQHRVLCTLPQRTRRTLYESHLIQTDTPPHSTSLGARPPSIAHSTSLCRKSPLLAQRTREKWGPGFLADGFSLRLHQLRYDVAAAADAVGDADATVGVAGEREAGESLAETFDAVEAVEVSNGVLGHGGLPSVDAGEKGLGAQPSNLWSEDLLQFFANDSYDLIVGGLFKTPGPGSRMPEHFRVLTGRPVLSVLTRTWILTRVHTAATTDFMWNLEGQQRTKVSVALQTEVFPFEFQPRLFVDFPKQLREQEWTRRQGAWLLRRFADEPPVSGFPWYFTDTAVRAFIPLTQTGAGFDVTKVQWFQLPKYASQLYHAKQLEVRGAKLQFAGNSGTLQYPRRFALRADTAADTPAPSISIERQ